MGRRDDGDELLPEDPSRSDGDQGDTLSPAPDEEGRQDESALPPTTDEEGEPLENPSGG
jgi:hypothetical protein